MKINLFNRNRYVEIIFKSLLVLTFLISPLLAKAQGSYTLLEPLPCIPGNGVTCTAGTLITKPDFATYVQYLFNLAIAIAAVSAVFMIVWGGFQYMTSEAPGVKSDGIKKVENAIYGLLLVLSSFLILKTIDPRLVAIPSTLVEPLKIKCPTDEKILRSDPACKKDSISDFFTQLTNEAEKYKVNNQQALINREQAKQKETDLLSQKTDLEKKLETAKNNNDVQQINSLEAQLVNLNNDLRDNRTKIQTEQAISVFNHALTVLAANADQNLLTGSDALLSPDAGASVRKTSLETIEKATKDIYNMYVSTYNKINDPQNPQSPQYISNLIKNGDDSLLKATQIYIETYKSNKPSSIPSVQVEVLNMLRYKNSFALNDPIKNQQKNELLINLCRQEVSSIREDPNLCK